ncbi:hypothetical protein EHS25_008385 [Saitozyma podzolica]|uniref:Piwi domain-containing protein n=1 Tax=Saitozyma podzolica TaxID=1890683 RepID=A0A427YPE0_9TREE|nr:hypothetical protein EHS25_008385 [Saitozyma podzolica]
MSHRGRYDDYDEHELDYRGRGRYDGTQQQLARPSFQNQRLHEDEAHVAHVSNFSRTGSPLGSPSTGYTASYQHRNFHPPPIPSARITELDDRGREVPPSYQRAADSGTATATAPGHPPRSYGMAYESQNRQPASIAGKSEGRTDDYGGPFGTDRIAGERHPPPLPTPAPSTVSASVIKDFEEMRLTSYYVRPGYGSIGRPLSVLSNYFAVRSKGRAKIIHHYDVEIDPVVKTLNQKKPKGLLRAVWEQVSLEQSGDWGEAFAAAAYDGRKNCFTPTAFPISRNSVQTFTTAIAPDNIVQRPGHRDESSSDDEYRRFRVTIKHVADIDLERVMEFCRADQQAPHGEEECLTGLMATNVLMRDVPSKRYAQVGATGNRFFTLEGAVSIPQGAIVCRGFMQSFRCSNSGFPLLNLDIGFSAFLASGPALEVIAKILGRDRGGGDINELSPTEIGIIKNKLRGAKFTVTHRPSTRLHTIMSITVQPAENIVFTMDGKNGEGEQKISIPEYYRQFYSATVTKPRLPCVQYGKKAFIPIEFVRLANWNSLPPTKLTADQTAAMIKEAAMRPTDRAHAVLKWRQELDHSNQAKIREWGLQVNTNMVQLQARVLPAPRVLYANNVDARVDKGMWNLRGKQFFRPGRTPLVAWAVISFDRYTDRGTMQSYVTYLCDTLIAHGVPVVNRQPSCIGPVDPRKEENVKGALQEAARDSYIAGKKAVDAGRLNPAWKCAPQLICVVLPGKDAWLYETIKRASFNDLKGPVPTQCMQAAKIRGSKGIEAYTGNLVMKIQSKLGGLTHQIPLSELPGMVKGKTMLLGGDLGHPPIKAGYADAPTVACTIATYTPDCDAYSAQIRLQEGRGEIIVELSSMIEEHLKIFHRKNGEYPERILIFRDGLSEGQYAAALQYEHHAVITACRRLQRDYRPRILLCVCAKRHNTRFFGRAVDCDGSGNLPAGLVVDRSVTNPYAFDFFLQAHAGRVGTARPTHYICLLDELAISPDQLQQLVHSLCYAFARCTRSVSLVPVCYIADLVCQKARLIVNDPNAGTSFAPSESSAGNRNNNTRASQAGYSRAGSGGQSTTRGGRGLDVMQVQNIMARNPELADVAWWM